MNVAPSYTYEQIVAAETAIELLTQAQAILSRRLAETAPDDHALRSRIEAKAKEVYTLQQSIRIEDDAGVRAITATWGPRVKSERRFWREL